MFKNFSYGIRDWYGSGRYFAGNIKRGFSTFLFELKEGIWLTHRSRAASKLFESFELLKWAENWVDFSIFKVHTEEERLRFNLTFRESRRRGVGSIGAGDGRGDVVYSGRGEHCCRLRGLGKAGGL